MMYLHRRIQTLVALLATICIGTVTLPAEAALRVPATLDQDASIPRLALNGYTYHSESFGAADKPVLMVLHGGPGADYRYLLNLKALADEYHVVFYDQRGTGLSPRVPADQITLQTFVDDLDALVTHFGKGRPVHLLGHSWGAMLASAYTGAHPGKVNRLILAEPGFLDASTADVFNRGGMPPLRVIWGFGMAWLGKWFVRTGDDAYARNDWFLLQVMPLMQGKDALCEGRVPPMEAWRFGSPNFEATIGRMMDDPAFTKQLDFRKNVDQFQGATLFMAGACNKSGGELQQRKLMQHFAHARISVIPDAGHFMFNDQPQRSVAVVRDFLRVTPKTVQ